MHVRVVNVRDKHERWDVYVGRGRDPRTGRYEEFNWGNPFPVGRGRTRDAAVAAHKLHVLTRPWLVDKIRAELHRKILGCWCAPLSCHADTLATIADTVPVPHVYEQHEHCQISHCQVCEGGLSICTQCGGAEGGLTSECPGVRGFNIDAVYRGELNFICGVWVPESLPEPDDGIPERRMPYWCGTVHGGPRVVPVVPPAHPNCRCDDRSITTADRT